MPPLAYPDACPVCPPGDHDACLPLAPAAEADGITAASYEHAVCGTSWRTAFDQHGWPVTRDIAPVTPVQAAANLATLRRAIRGSEAA